MSKVLLPALLAAVLAPSSALLARQQPGHEGHNHPPLPAQEHAPAAPSGPVRLVPVSAERVALQAGQLGQWYEICRTAALPALLAHIESSGFVTNFAIAAGRERGEHRGGVDADLQVYAFIEAASNTLLQKGDPALEAKLGSVVDAVVAAQGSDGYLGTRQQVGKEHAPWSDLALGRELEACGRLIDAGLAHQRATRQGKLLGTARKFADHVERAFGPGRKSDPGAYPGIEGALARLCVATGEARYLALAKFFVDQRGNLAGRTGYGAIAQDAKPLRGEKLFLGDPVRGTRFYAGATEVARQIDDPELSAALVAIFEDATTTKMNVVGGLGNASARDGITGPYDIASGGTTFDLRSAIGLAEWAHALGISTGDARYFDVVERALHNAILCGLGFDGRSFGCVGRLDGSAQALRAGFPAAGECGADLVRFIARIPDLVFAVAGNSIYVAQYVPTQADFEVGGAKVHMEFGSTWPTGGLAEVKVQCDKQATFAIKFRRPAWCKTVFYQHDMKEKEHSTDYPGGTAGWEVYERRYDPMDGCKINCLGPVRREAPLAEVASDKSRVAICRGPLVYALEGVDNKSGAHAIVLAPTASLTALNKPDPVFTTIRAFKTRDGRIVDAGADGTPILRGGEVVLVPYFQLGNRGASDFVVWVPETPELVKPPAAPGR